MTEHEMIMLGVLNKKKCLPLKSFARHRWGRKGKETVAPSGKKKRDKTHLLYYILHG